MFRFISRLVVVAAVVLALLVVTVPVAQARPLVDRSEARVDTSWFQAALSWLLGFVPTGGHAPMERAAASDSTPTGTAHPMTGSCIDPQGGGRWCTGI